MTYIPDGTNQDYTDPHYGVPLFKTTYAWGWLDSKETYNQGWEDKKLKRDVLTKLKRLNSNHKEGHRVDLYMGFQLCGFCKQGKHEGFNGSLKIGHNDKCYVSPWGVEHYIKTHNYRPPDEVVDAILNGHFYTYPELEKLANENPEYIKKKAEAEQRQEKRMAQNEEYTNRVREAGKRLANDPEWKKKLNKAMMHSWNFIDIDEQQ